MRSHGDFDEGLYVLVYAAYLAIEPDIRLPFGVCLVSGWRRACHLTLLSGQASKQTGSFRLASLLDSNSG